MIVYSFYGRLLIKSVEFKKGLDIFVKRIFIDSYVLVAPAVTVKWESLAVILAPEGWT